MLLGYECGNPREFLTANSESISTERNSIRFAIKDIALIISPNLITKKNVTSSPETPGGGSEWYRKMVGICR